MFLFYILFSLLNSPDVQSFTSLRYLATGSLIKGAEEMIKNPSYLFKLDKSHLFLNLRDFSDESGFLTFGGNINTDPFREAGYIKIGTIQKPLPNSQGGFGLSTFDKIEYIDSDSDGVYDKLTRRRFETSGDSSLFYLEGYTGFQFQLEEWFISASFEKSQYNLQVEKPGDFYSPLGYFKYIENNLTFPQNGYINTIVGSGDYLEKSLSNFNHVRLGGGFILEDSSLFSLMLGYRIFEERKTIDGFYSFSEDFDTTRRETHLRYDQFKMGEDSSFVGDGYSIGFDYLKSGRNIREINFLFWRDNQTVDSISRIVQKYYGLSNTTVDTFLQNYDSVYTLISFLKDSKGRSSNNLLVSYSEVISFSPDFSFAFGIKGHYSYTYFSKISDIVDSTEVVFSDGDTISSDADDYTRIIKKRFREYYIDEGKNYSIHIPFGMEITPFSYKKLKFMAGSIFTYSQKETMARKEIRPLTSLIDSTFRNDSTYSVIQIPLSEGVSANKKLEKLSTVDFTYGINLSLNDNVDFYAACLHRKAKFEKAYLSIIFKF